MKANNNKSRYIKSFDDDKKLLKRIAVFFLIAYIVFPQYFGISTPVFDLTAQRFMIIVIVLLILDNKTRMQKFVKDIRELPFFKYVFVYLGICLFVALYRRHFGSFFYPFIEILGLFLLYFILKNYTDLETIIKVINIIAFVLTILGIFEYVTHYSVFWLLETIQGAKSNPMIRSGSYRIMGPAGHSLAYGLILNSFVVLSCIEAKTKTLNLLQNKVLLLLIIINIFLTGSRSSLAIMFLELAMLFALSSNRKKKEVILFLLVAISVLALIVILGWGSSLSNYIMLQVTGIVDEILGTTYSVDFGADVQTLTNSSEYREYLPQIFSSSALSPIIGRGSGYHFHWYVDGYNIISIDNFYVAEYIRYAYPGLIAFVVFIVRILYDLLFDIVKNKSGLSCAIFSGMVCYFINLWFMDTLQTLKYVYILIVVYYVWRDKYIKRGN